MKPGSESTSKERPVYFVPEYASNVYGVLMLVRVLVLDGGGTSLDEDVVGAEVMVAGGEEVTSAEGVGVLNPKVSCQEGNLFCLWPPCSLLLFSPGNDIAAKGQVK